jgi:DNA-binding GntR family transcriptional regulator
MQAERSDLALGQRAIVLQVLREDHPERWSRSELEQAILEVGPSVVGEALTRLAAEGVVVLDDDGVQASECAKRLDALGLLAI